MKINKWLILISMILTSTSSAAQYFNDKQYIVLEHPITTNHQILVFFSFYCSYCYQLEEKLHILNKVKRVLPKDTKIDKYHVEFLGPLGKELTQAWAVAIILDIEDKMIIPIFKAVQKTHTVQNITDIRKIFIDAGVKSNEYDIAWNSYIVQSMVAQQKKAIMDLKLQYIPAIFIKGKYQINLQEMNISNMDLFIQQYTDTVQYLLKKNDR